MGLAVAWWGAPGYELQLLLCHLADECFIIWASNEEIFSPKFVRALPPMAGQLHLCLKMDVLLAHCLKAPWEGLSEQFFWLANTSCVCLRTAVEINCPGEFGLICSHRSTSLISVKTLKTSAKTSINRPHYQRGWAPQTLLPLAKIVDFQKIQIIGNLYLNIPVQILYLYVLQTAALGLLLCFVAESSKSADV